MTGSLHSENYWKSNNICIYAEKLAAMEKMDIEILIRGCVQKNHQVHPGAFSDPVLKSIETAKALAAAYWQHRTDDEIKRDTSAKVTQADYEDWVKKEILETKGPELYN